MPSSPPAHVADGKGGGWYCGEVVSDAVVLIFLASVIGGVFR